MTSGSPSQPSPKNEAQYARKLALAILSTLESKGFLNKVDVDTILAVAHRAALQADAETAGEADHKASSARSEVSPPPASSPEPAGSSRPDSSGLAAEAAGTSASEASAAAGRDAVPARQSVLSAPIEVKRPLGPAVLGTRWVKPDAPTPQVRSETADLIPEAGAVKIVGQGTSETAAGRRPLAPAIVTAGRGASTGPLQSGTPEGAGPREAEPGAEDRDREEPVAEASRPGPDPERDLMSAAPETSDDSEPQAEPDDKVADDKVTSDTVAGDWAPEEKDTERKEGSGNERPTAPLVIDFEMD